MTPLNVNIASTGGIDPWKELSVVQNGTREGEEAVFIEDAAHCADMMSKRFTDGDSLKKAREVQRVVLMFPPSSCSLHNKHRLLYLTNNPQKEKFASLGFH